MEHVADGAVAACNVQGPPGVNVTWPVGMTAPVMDVSVTVALHVDAWPTTTLVGLQDIIVEVGLNGTGLAVMSNVPAVL